MPKQNDPFSSIDPTALGDVHGGARVATGAGGRGSNDQLLAMMTTIANSIKDFAGAKNGGGDQMMQMVMMMTMMRGKGGSMMG
jgi:hypothetical protein